MTELEELRLAYAESSRQKDKLLTAHKLAAAKNAAPRPVIRDCRTCSHHRLLGGPFCLANICTNADRYDPLPPVRLWIKT